MVAAVGASVDGIDVGRTASGFLVTGFSVGKCVDGKIDGARVDGQLEGFEVGLTEGRLVKVGELVWPRTVGFDVGGNEGSKDGV